MILLLLLIAFPTLITAGNYSNQERLYRLPQLYYVDDYYRCLALNGVYCFGSFELNPLMYPNPNYEFMKNYSSELVQRFNRTRIHRGYCLSTRCPTVLNASEQFQNTSERFENCVSEWARKLSLRPKLYKLQYCHTSADLVKPQVYDGPDVFFLVVVITIILLNIIGTIYDSFKKHDVNKNKLLTSWSIPANWRRLINTTPFEDSKLNDLRPIQGHKSVIMFLAVAAHVPGVYMSLMTYEPHKIEDAWTSFIISIILIDNVGVIRIMAMIACFLTSYNLLLFSEKKQLSVKMLPLLLFKRITRMAPLYLIIIGFGATWWSHIPVGPFLKGVVAEYRDVCRRNYWSYMLLINNLVGSAMRCLPSSWGIVVDIQLSVICCFLTLLLARLRRRALPILAVIILVSCLFNTTLGYVFEWMPIRRYLHSLENLRVLLRDLPAFKYFYFQVWSSLPCGVVGVFLAHLHYELQIQNYKADNKWLKYGTPWLIPLTPVIAYYARVHGNMSRLVAALYLGFEDTALCIIGAIIIYDSINNKGILHRFFSWSGFIILGRLSLALSIINIWLIMTIAGSRLHPNIFSLTDLALESGALYILMVIIAIPLTVLVETPIRRFSDNIIFNLNFKTVKNAKNAKYDISKNHSFENVEINKKVI